MKIHLVAIGGAVMHNLALALNAKGYEVSGSDDEIFEPARSRLQKAGLLPKRNGWNAGVITPDLDLVILGMHAREDNPEYKKAVQLGLKIRSFPDFIYEQAKEKHRVVIGGSHGKTSITAMIMHALDKLDFDYLVGAQLDGFDHMVKLSRAPLIILEGDEYLSSVIERKPKFHFYKPQIALLSGIAWDHINVFPTFENYLEQFRIFINGIPDGGTLIYYAGDEYLPQLAAEARNRIKCIPYDTPSHQIRDHITYLITEGQEYPLEIFGAHNLQNLEGARLVCEELGVESKDFFERIRNFRGAACRLDRLGENEFTSVYRDFAHAPSKLRATVNALTQQYPERELVACLELHTFSSLSKDFLVQYKDSMKEVHHPKLYFDPKTLEHKKLPPISPDDIREAFGTPELRVYTDSAELVQSLHELKWDQRNLVMMSSGDFDGIDLDELTKFVLNHS